MQLIEKQISFSEMVMAIQGQAFTTSQKIADYLDKRYDNVLRKVRQTIRDCPSEFPPP